MKPIDLVDLAEAHTASHASAEAANDSHDAPQKEKSKRALRTISETADLLDVPQHVLRFWETKFPQIKPMKRNGGRRFYRPEDIELLQQIKALLYKQGYTIKGARKALEKGAMPVQNAPAPEESSGTNGAAEPQANLEDVKQRLQNCQAMLKPFLSV